MQTKIYGGMVYISNADTTANIRVVGAISLSFQAYFTVVSMIVSSDIILYNLNES